MIKKPSVLLLGSSGQLGKEISKNHLIRSNYSLLALDRNECDITNFEKIYEVIDKIKPAFVINCAAYTNVDQSEKSKDMAFIVNSVIPKNLINKNYVNNIFGLIFGCVKGFFFIFLSTSGIIYLFYTTKDFPLFLKNSLFFEPIKTYSIKVIEKIVNFI